MSAARAAATLVTFRREAQVLTWLQLLVAGLGAMGGLIGAMAAAAAGAPVVLVATLVGLIVVDGWIAGLALGDLWPATQGAGR